jgi:hypothetical protein
MATKLNLKKRLSRETLSLPTSIIKGLVDREDKEGLWNFFQSLADDNNVYVHDKTWLEFIINWMPQGGTPLTESAKWFKLASRVSDLDIEKEGPFTISPYQVDLVWQRLINPQFKMERLPVPFVQFIQEFQMATGKHFPEEEPDVEDESA